MGVLPLQFPEGKSADSLGLTGEETFDIVGITELNEGRTPKTMKVTATGPDGTKTEFDAVVRIDTPGERAYYLNGGILQQAGSPRELYDAPQNVFVAGFIGSPAMNLIGMPVTDGGVKFGSKVIPVPRDALGNAGGEVVVGVRPEDVDVRTEGDGLPVVIEVVEELGADAYVYGTPQTGHVAKEEGLAKPFIARVDGRRPPEKGQTLYITPQESRVHLFHPETGARLMD